jgi:hypothetical protein
MRRMVDIAGLGFEDLCLKRALSSTIMGASEQDATRAK